MSGINEVGSSAAGVAVRQPVATEAVAAPSAAAPAAAPAAITDSIVAARTGAAPATKEALSAAAENLDEVTAAALKSAKDLGRLADSEGLAKTIDHNKMETIDQFGLPILEKTNEYAKSLVEHEKNNQMGPMGDIVRDMMAQMNGFDRNIKIETSIFGKIFGQVKKAAAALSEFWQRYQTVETQIGALSSKLQGYEIQIRKDVGGAEALKKLAFESIDEYTVHIAAMAIALQNHRENTLPAARAKAVEGNGDTRANAELKQAERAELAMDTRLTELINYKGLAEQQVYTYDQTIDTGRQAAARILKVRKEALPLFWQVCAQSAMLFKQKSGVELSDDVVQGMNKMYQESAVNLRSTAVLVAKSTLTHTVSSETLTKVSSELAGMMGDLAAIAQQGKELNAKARTEAAAARKVLGDAILRANTPAASN